MQPLFSYSYYPRSLESRVSKPVPNELEPYTYPNNYENALKLIKAAVNDEKDDANFYNYLVSIAPTEEAKKIISGIRDDELEHNQMFRTIYQALTNENLPLEIPGNFERPKCFCCGVKKSVIIETDAIKEYSLILSAMQDRVHINMVTEIINDEIRHASLFNLLYAMRGC